MPFLQEANPEDPHPTGCNSELGGDLLPPAARESQQPGAKPRIREKAWVAPGPAGLFAPRAQAQHPAPSHAGRHFPLLVLVPRQVRGVWLARPGRDVALGGRPGVLARTARQESPLAAPPLLRTAPCRPRQPCALHRHGQPRPPPRPFPDLASSSLPRLASTGGGHAGPPGDGVGTRGSQGLGYPPAPAWASQ